MARIILASWFIRYPLGGMNSWVLQYLTGFHDLGHEIYFVEKSGYQNSSYDPVRKVMTDDCSYGLGVISRLLEQSGLPKRFCYVDQQDRYHGLSRQEIDEAFASADLFIEMGAHETWLEESRLARQRILIDGDPGFNQIWMADRLAAGEKLPEYDLYFTVGANIGTSETIAPDCGVHWHRLYSPVNCRRFAPGPPPPGAPVTTVMNWQSYGGVEFQGQTYGHKNLEFEKFIELPRRVNYPLEAAISGHFLPYDRIRQHGWRVEDGHAVTLSVDRYYEYIRNSSSEFSVCKQGFVALNTGWFSERSAVYLACGRPVVMEDTGFSSHLPCGRGLFACSTVDEAGAAIEEIHRDYDRHSKAAREIAVEHLDTPKILGQLLETAGVQ